MTPWVFMNMWYPKRKINKTHKIRG
jgi:hypothetical protein